MLPKDLLWWAVMKILLTALVFLFLVSSAQAGTMRYGPVSLEHTIAETARNLSEWFNFKCVEREHSKTSAHFTCYDQAKAKRMGRDTPTVTMVRGVIRIDCRVFEDVEDWCDETADSIETGLAQAGRKPKRVHHSELRNGHFVSGKNIVRCMYVDGDDALCIVRPEKALTENHHYI